MVSSDVANPQETADLVTLTEEIHNGNFIFCAMSFIHTRCVTGTPAIIDNYCKALHLRSFPLRFFSVNETKFTGSCKFGHIY